MAGLVLTTFYCNAQRADFESINFQEADNSALKYKNDGLNNLPELAYHLTYQLQTDVEKFRAIYKWVCSTVSNDYELYERNMRNRQRFKDDTTKLKIWNEKFRKISFRKLRNNQRAICTGYAYLVKELSNLANIQCEIVNGYAKTSTIDLETLTMPNHSWNAVKLNGKWYLCDPTWASGIPDAETFQFKFNYNDGYFLTEPSLFAINHFPQDANWLLINESPPTFGDFLKSPLLYGQGYAILNSFSEPKKMLTVIDKNENIKFECQLRQSMDVLDISLLLDNGRSYQRIVPENIKIIDKSLTIEYKFKHAGFYDVHLYIGPNLISTCTVKVKK